MKRSTQELIDPAGTAGPLVPKRLFGLLYAELHRLPKRHLRDASDHLTLGATTLGSHRTVVDTSQD